MFSMEKNCMYVCMYVHEYKYIYVYISTYMHTCILIRIYLLISRIHKRMCVCPYGCMYLFQEQWTTKNEIFKTK
jgi:hypothetical protein